MQPKKIQLSEEWLQLSPELLLHHDWEKPLPPPESWMERRVSWVRRILDDEPWKTWDQADWINALVFVGVGLAVLGNVATFIAEVRRASTVGA